MKFYLSSYKLGKKVAVLKKMIPKNSKTAYIPNAIDYSKDEERLKESLKKGLQMLRRVGLNAEVLDLKDYFGKKNALEKKMREFGVFFVRGGNTFVLRQAMALSGFDVLIRKLAKSKKDVLYAGYSAGVCILSPSLKGLELVDDPTQKPYGKRHETIWQGLGLINYAVAPHYRSNHPESKLVDKEVEYLIKNHVLFKALRDGEVLILE